MSRCPIKILATWILLVASFNLAWQFYRMEREHAERQKLVQETGFIVCKFGPDIDEISRPLIFLCLIFSFVGCWLKTFKGTLLNVLSLTGATILYVYWWQFCFWLAEESDIHLYYLPHLLYLYEATVLDILLAITVGVLILLHLSFATLRFNSPRDL